MLVWYVDREIKIEFDKKPIVSMCYPNPCYSNEKNRIIDDNLLNRTLGN